MYRLKSIIKKLWHVTKVPGEYSVYDLGYDGSTKKRVLISYVTDMLKGSLLEYRYNTNRHECLVIINTFLEMGYIVDVVSCTDKRFKPRHSYDVVFGFGFPFRNTPSPERILYVTEAHPAFSLQQESIRVANYNQYHSKKASVTRSLKYYIDSDFELATSIINLGELNRKFISEKVNTPIFSVEVTGIYSEKYHSNKSNDGIKRFICLTSNGVVHKGVDLLVDFFSNTSEKVELVIAGITSKKELDLVYKSDNNIKFIDRIDVNGKEFFDLANNSQFIINASCSEGCSTAVLTGLRYGLIPVVTEACNINISGKITIEDDLKLGVNNAVQRACGYSFDELKIISQKIYDEANDRFTLPNYKMNIDKILNEILGNDPSKVEVI